MPRAIPNVSGMSYESVRLFMSDSSIPSLIMMGPGIRTSPPSIIPPTSSSPTTPATWASMAGGKRLLSPHLGLRRRWNNRRFHLPYPHQPVVCQGFPGDNLGQFGWGQEDCIPVPGDYNGDGIVERAFYHCPHEPLVHRRGGGPLSTSVGRSGSIPLPWIMMGTGRRT